jgi:hypothetical protein
MAVTLEEANAMVGKPQGLTIDQANAKIAPKVEPQGAGGAYIDDVLKTTKEVWHALYHPGQTAEQNIESTKQVAVGAAKAIGGGVLSLGELAAQGLHGVVSTIQGRGFTEGMESQADFQKKTSDVIGAITKINLAPEGQEQEAMNDLLALFPKAITAAGDTVFEKTGSAIAGAGTQAIGTLLMLKPSVAGKVVDTMKGKAIKDAATVSPETINALADHIAKDNKEIADKLKAVAEGAQDKPDGKLREAGEKSIKPRVRVVGETAEGKPRVRVMTPEQISSGMRDASRDAREGAMPAVEWGDKNDYNWESATEKVPLSSNEKIGWKSKAQILFEQGYMDKGEYNYSIFKLNEGKLSNVMMASQEKFNQKKTVKPTEIEDAKALAKHKWPSGTPIVPFKEGELDPSAAGPQQPIMASKEHQVAQEHLDKLFWSGDLSKAQHKTETLKLETEMHKAQGEVKPPDDDIDFGGLTEMPNTPVAKAGPETHEPSQIDEQPHPIEPALSTQLPPVKTDIQTAAQSRVVRAPSGEVINSRNLPVHSTKEGQANFLRWFGDSETVDYLGRPLVFYHSTPHDIKVWNQTYPGRIRNFLSFTTDRKFASSWGDSSSKVYPVYVRAKNIGDFRNPAHVKQVAEYYGISKDNPDLMNGTWSVWEEPNMWDQFGWEGTWMREGMSTPSINLAIRRDRSNVKSQKYNTGAYSEHEDPTMKQGEGAGDLQWRQFHDQVGPEVWAKLEEAFHAGVPLSTHEFLDILLKTDSPYKDIISHLRKHVEDVPIRPTMEDIVDRSGKQWPHNTPGLWDPVPREIHLRIDAQGPQRLQTALHEVVHAATSTFIHNNPFHPLTVELRRLHTIAIARAKDVISHAKIMGTPLKGTLEKIGSGRPYRGDYKGTDMFYGLTDLREFMAEAITRASFQRMLLHSEKFAKAWQTLRATTNRMIETIGKMFGLNKMKDTSLLGSIMDLTQRITEAQSTERRGMYEERPSPAEEDDPFNPKPKPGFHVAVGKIAGYADQAIKTFAPEALGPEAKTAGATIAKNIAKQMQSDSAHSHQAAARRSWWIKHPDMIRGFIEKAEKGERLKNPFMEKGRREYERQNKAIYLQDKAAGFTYDEREHYMAHIFEDGQKAIDVIRAKYGKKWGDPAFIKDRMWDMYEEAIKAGVRPKFTNPEDIMLARWHASDIARMRVDSLREMENFGVAKLMTKEDHAPPEYPATQWRSPNGDWYWVHNDAYSVMSNAFDSKSLWELKGLGGDVFRGAMGLKNRIVPIKLALSLFHPLHVATIDNATAMVRASKELLSGESNPIKWAGQMVSAALYGGKSGIPFSALYDNPHQGSRVLKLWQGKLKDHQVTDADRQALTYLFEGGLIPEMSAQFRTNSKRLFKDALDKQSAVVVFHAPFAALEATQGLMFDKWIPSLKIASYLKDVEAALKVDPSLIEDQNRRQQAFRRIAKSVDNRYGEMAYNTLFWNKMVKDLFVVNTLSLGWNLGFIREYGGGALDIGQFTRQGGKLQAIKEGKLDRPMFVLFYSAQALMYAGLMTWAFSGKPPQQPIDYIYPQTGGNDKDGKPNRANTMFYPREFYAVAKHIQAKGWFSGLSEAVLNKVAPMIGMARDGATGVNSMHQQIRDPNVSEFKQVEQTLVALWGEGKPISMMSAERGPGGAKGKILAYSGFGPAPKYATDTPTEGRIKALYDKTYAQQETPYMQAEKSKEAKAAKEAYMSGDAKYNDLMEAMKEKFDPDDKDPKFESKMTRAWNKEEGGETAPPAAKLFQRMIWQDQQRLLDEMTEEEREVYLPFSNKTYLRDNYEPPEKRKRH